MVKILIGAVIILGSVIGSFVLGNGHLAALWQPLELMTLFGCAIGATVISNSPMTLKKIGKGYKGIFFGKTFQKKEYLDLLALLHDVFNKWRREGLMSLEGDIEEPANSEIFKKYPNISKDHYLVDFICDYLRIISSGNLSALELEALMDVELDTIKHEKEAAGEAVSKMADGFPGFGIVAAVMGIVITMGHLGGPPQELGAHVGAALVGTFLGILFAYGFFGPFAVAMGQMGGEEFKVYEVVKTAILAMVNGMPPQLAVEFGRKVLFNAIRPTFQEMDAHIRGNKG